MIKYGKNKLYLPNSLIAVGDIHGEAEKLKSLAEGVEFVDADSYATKIQTLRENYFPSGVKAQTELDKIEPGTEGQTMIAEETNNPMSKYVRALGKTLPN